MPSTYSPSLRLELIANGEQAETWGDTTNRNFGTVLDQAIAGVSPIPVAGLSSHTLSTANGSADQARRAVLAFYGTPSVDPMPVVAPAVNKVYLVHNQTPATLRFGVVGATKYAMIPPGACATVYCTAPGGAADGAKLALASTENYQRVDVNYPFGVDLVPGVTYDLTYRDTVLGLNLHDPAGDPSDIRLINKTGRTDIIVMTGPGVTIEGEAGPHTIDLPGGFTLRLQPGTTNYYLLP